MSFWTKDKNTNLCTYLRDRYRGLDTVLSPMAVVDFGRCWTERWEPNPNDKVDKGAAHAEFEFEAFLVPKETLAEKEPDEKLWRGSNKAQMIWKPGKATFATGFSEDLRRVLPTGKDRAFLLRSTVSPTPSARGSAPERATIDNVTSITDSLGQSQGALANAAELDPNGAWNRIDELWRQRIDQHAGGQLSEAEAANLNAAFETFHAQYTEAIKAITDEAGEGLASSALVDQAKSYGNLLNQLRRTARADILVRDLWEPLLQIGTATVSGDADAMIIAPWHPLRLAELGAKAKQAAHTIEQIVSSPSDKTREVGAIRQRPDSSVAADILRDRRHESFDFRFAPPDGDRNQGGVQSP